MPSHHDPQEHGGWLWAGKPPKKGDIKDEAIRMSAIAILVDWTSISEGDDPHSTYCSAAEIIDARRKAMEKFAQASPPTTEQAAKARTRIATVGAAEYHSQTKGNTTDRHRREDTLLREFGNGETAPCVYCGKRLGRVDSDLEKLTQDHIWPASEGGRFIMENLVPACAGCNQHRSDRAFTYWLMLWKEVEKYGRRHEVRHR